MADHSFKKNLKAPPCQALAKSYFDDEIKALSIVKDFATKRAELERDQAKKTRACSAKALKEIRNTQPSSQSAIYDACLTYLTQIECEATMLEQRSDRMLELCTKDLGSLLQAKTEVKDKYESRRETVERNRESSMTDVVARKKSYDKMCDLVTKCEKAVIKAKGKKQAVQTKTKCKLEDAVRDMLLAHNEYVCAIAGNAEHINRYNDTLLPGVLESLEDVERFLVADVKTVLKDLTNAVDPASSEYQKYRNDLQLLHEKVDALDGATEYVPLCISSAEYTELHKPLDFKFNDLMSEQANEFEELESGLAVAAKPVRQTETEKKEGFDTDLQDFQLMIEAENGTIEKFKESPSDLSVPASDPTKRSEQIRAHEQLCEHTIKKADLECQMAVIQTKQAVLQAGLDKAQTARDDGGDTSGFGFDDDADQGPPPPPRPAKRGSKRSVTSQSPEVPQGDALEDQPWFHGVLARVKVNELLKDNADCQQGDFLVRESARDPDQLVLSVFVKPRISHFKITKDEVGKYSFESESFETVAELVNYHLREKVILTHKSGAVIRRSVTRRQRPFTHEDVELGSKIGKGNFGDVFKGVIKRTGVEVAIKTCRDTVSNPERFLEEADTLNQYNHPNIVTLYGVVKHTPVMILLELCLGGELLKFLRSKNEQIEVGQKVKMCLESGLGMAYLHSKMCIHRDLAARNCLLTGGTPNTLKISDFGMSRVNEDDEDLYTVQTTAKTIPIRWTAPEALEHLEYHTATDVWSYGILMWEIFTGGKLPYAGFNNAQVRHEVIQNAYRLSQPDDCPDDLMDIMRQCWQYDPNQRPTMKVLCDDLERIKAHYPYDSEVC